MLKFVAKFQAHLVRTFLSFAAQSSPHLTWAAYFDQLYASARTALSLPSRTVTQWMDLAPEQRRPWIERADLRTSAALLILEQAAQRRTLAQVRETLKRRYLASDRNEGDAPDVVRRLMQESAYLGRPSRLLDGSGYGIPQADERAALEARSATLRADLQSMRAALEQGAREWMGPQRRERLDGIAANSELLGKRLRALHAEQGGLRLP